ncbi:MAG TPA: hypothetical protein VGE74_21055 [Gemmata sp.]
MTALTEPVSTAPAAVAGGPPLFALWEIVAVENHDEVVTFFAVTGRDVDPPDVRAGFEAVRAENGLNWLSRVHSVRLVTRMRSERDAGRFAGAVLTHAIADQRARVVSPRDLGVGA